MSLGFNSEKATSFAKDIDEIEKKLDLLYIKVDLDIVTGNGDLASILILRDVARELERLGDKVHEASRPSAHTSPLGGILLSDAPVEVEVLADGRLVVWSIEDSRRLFNTDFYGKPLGNPKPKEDFDEPLILDLVEGVYLLRRRS